MAELGRVGNSWNFNFRGVPTFLQVCRQRENFMESLHSDGFATYPLIIWVEKIIPLTMKSKQKPYPSIVLYIATICFTQSPAKHFVFDFYTVSKHFVFDSSHLSQQRIVSNRVNCNCIKGFSSALSESGDKNRLFRLRACILVNYKVLNL